MQSPRSWRRLWLFRAGAVLCGLGLLALFELCCVLLDWGRPTDVDDPFVGFSAVHPLFVRAASPDHFETAPSRRDFFPKQMFAVEKPAREFRAFCLGGSTVRGRPFGVKTAFTRWLEVGLSAIEPGRRWRFVNCGGISYASYRLVPILEECLTHAPDLIVICTGHNEFLEDRTYGDLKRSSGFLDAAHRGVARLRTYGLLRRGYLALRGEPELPSPPVLAAEVQALLDFQGGLAAYERDSAWREGVIRHFAFNVRRMVARAKRAGVPVILVLPPSNLSDCPPFKSLPGATLPDADRAAWRDARARLEEARGDVALMVSLLERLRDLDDAFAWTHYTLGKCYESQGRIARARRSFLAAREHDICPLRILAPMEDALRVIAKDTGVTLIDAHARLEASSTEPVLGDELLVDHIHPSPVRGHQLLTNAVLAELARRGIVRLSDSRLAQVTAAYAAHAKTLDAMYYQRGRRALRGLRDWTQGRVDGPPLPRRPR